MPCDQCVAIEAHFNEGEAEADLQRYRENGPSRTTRILIDALLAEGVDGQSLLDIGGGIGAIQLELLEHGLRNVVSVEASSAYDRVADREAENRGYASAVERHRGDFVTLAPKIGQADIVTLDRVVCCYDDMQALVGLSSQRARRLYGLVYPRDEWWMKAFGLVQNGLHRVRRSPFRMFIHSTQAVEAILYQAGMQLRFSHMTAFWRIVVYGKP